jgi:hypothetical protein
MMREAECIKESICDSEECKTSCAFAGLATSDMHDSECHQKAMHALTFVKTIFALTMHANFTRLA